MDERYNALLSELYAVYRKKIRPLEVNYHFEGFHSAPLSQKDIEAKPMVLLLGQYSVGKTTFIQHLLGREYPGAHIGVEPTTDRFVAIMDGPEERVIPGNAAAVSAELPFGGLQRFGTTLLSRFQVSQMNHPLLRQFTLIDTPGILSGDKQRLASRGYDFSQVTAWFAERSDLIIMLFDGNKLDISDEFKMAIHALRGHEDKIRVVLNKSDQVPGQQLLRVYGALMWSLGKVVNSPEVMRVYLGSFWSEPPHSRYDDCREIIEAEQRDLMKDLEMLPRNAAVRRVNELVKRSRNTKVHAYIIGHLKREMPAMFGKNSKQAALEKNIAGVFEELQRKYKLSPGDFPNPDVFRQCLQGYKFNKFNSLEPKLISALETITPSERQTYLLEFQRICPRGKLSGVDARPILEETRLPQETLAHIWRLADWDADGNLDAAQYVVAKHYTRIAQQGGTLPDQLPAHMAPSYTGASMLS
ncbi:P-loop containing nucleoside triphosphate hydrolase protein [Syncephalis pseudoplumigaleata]|uniref:P-loop containing nucleoside triphosphate hydrolase protein n=1 Tax=Syncephalis pseudoplumigaleata TaxID=1712513 RepID=A0A4P9YWK5_9FUNG|nr:P-loop containing nucleoside triphosphate hydrolase protein [Syncephalis pseudoplumigaleata]|eukprot:RKP23691.1 P-loop containing nucleoside triphosphate hydrolase protein [Syncephalis pseudoplumigaleata]